MLTDYTWDMSQAQAVVFQCKNCGAIKVSQDGIAPEECFCGMRGPENWVTRSGRIIERTAEETVGSRESV
jgi:hypothetical protein